MPSPARYVPVTPSCEGFKEDPRNTPAVHGLEKRSSPVWRATLLRLRSTSPIGTGAPTSATDSYRLPCTERTFPLYADPHMHTPLLPPVKVLRLTERR